MSNYLVISIIATDSPGLAETFSRITSQNNCNIEDSLMAVMGNEFSATLLVSGAPEDINTCENAITNYVEEAGHQVICKQTQENPGSDSSRPYGIHTLSLDAPGIIRNITDFMQQRDINISNLVTNSYKAPHTGAPMLEVQMTANVPAATQISQLREDFADFCDELHIDAAFDPIK